MTQRLEKIGFIFAGDKKTKRFNKNLGICVLCDRICWGIGKGLAMQIGVPGTEVSELPAGIKTKAFHTKCFVVALEVFTEGMNRAHPYFAHN